MSSLQQNRVAPPTENDKERGGLQDFAEIIQRNFEGLFGYAHEHITKTALPAASDGKPQDIVLVDDGTNVYIVVKTSRGWFRSAALTAL